VGVRGSTADQHGKLQMRFGGEYPADIGDLGGGHGWCCLWLLASVRNRNCSFYGWLHGPHYTASAIKTTVVELLLCGVQALASPN
jgi:hypothetical protein